MRSLLAVLWWLLAAMPTLAAEPLPIFDAHLHYNWEPKPHLPLDQVLALFRANGINGILANSRPNDGTHALVASQAPGLAVVPFIRPYRQRADIQTWFNDPAIYELIEAEYARGGAKGIGEFHIYGDAAAGPWVKKMVEFAGAHGLYLLAHCDEAALLHLFTHDPKAKVIWAHTGFSTPVGRVDELLASHATLWGELSYRGGITEGRELTPGWRWLFERRPERFLLGSDTWINERWDAYGEIMRGYRLWLEQLPRPAAEQIAHGNAERLFR